MNRKAVRTFWSGMLCGLLVLASAGRAEVPVVKIGVLSVPFDTHAPIWAASVEHLNQTFKDHTFTLVPLKREALYQAAQKKELDFVIGDALAIAQLEATAGMEPLVSHARRCRDYSFALTGGTLFCLHKRKDLKSPAELRHGKIAAVDENSLAGWLCVLRKFRKRFIDPTVPPGQVRFLGSEEAVINAVKNEEVDAGVLEAGAMERMAAANKIDRDDYRVLFFRFERQPDIPVILPFGVSTELYPDWSAAAGSRVSYDLAKRVATALFAMPMPMFPLAGDNIAESGWVPAPSFADARLCLQEMRIHPFEKYGTISWLAVFQQFKYPILGLGSFILLLIFVNIHVLQLNRELASENRERRKAERDLHISLKRFEHIVHCSKDWIWEADRNGKLTYTSGMVESMLGYKPEEIVGKGFFDLMSSVERQRLEKSGKTHFGKDEELFRERFRFVTREGRVVIHECTAEPVFNSYGMLNGYRGVNRDITSQVRFIQM